MKKILFSLLFVAFLCSCTGFGFKDVLIRNGIKNNKIYLGCTQQEVVDTIGGVSSMCRKVRYTPAGTIELWDYASSSGSCGANLSESYALIFKNGILVEIRTVRNSLDLQI